jgi:hypothetical protein
MGYQKMAISESANEVNIPRITAMTPPPIPGPMYRYVCVKNRNRNMVI